MVIGFLFYYVFSIVPVSDLLLRPLERTYPPLSESDFQRTNKIVFLLGGPETDILRSNGLLKTYRGQGFNKIKAEIIISGTDPLNPGESEANREKNFLINQGISPNNIILEDKSRNTFENAKDIKKIVGSKPFFLVTSAYHMPRAVEIFQKLGTNPIPAPTDFKTSRGYNVLDFFPSGSGLKKSGLALHEYFGIIFYQLRY